VLQNQKKKKRSNPMKNGAKIYPFLGLCNSNT